MISNFKKETEKLQKQKKLLIGVSKHSYGEMYGG